jgi:hypothetical protein
MKKTELYDFLKSNGFAQLEQITSDYFGDYLDLFECENFGLRFRSSKSNETVDIYSLSDKEEMFDLALVKALILKETVLNVPTTIDKYHKFLKNELHQIKLLFLNSNYIKIKRKLDDLGNERAKQMFPGMIK